MDCRRLDRANQNSARVTGRKGGKRRGLTAEFQTSGSCAAEARRGRAGGDELD